MVRISELDFRIGFQNRFHTPESQKPLRREISDRLVKKKFTPYQRAMANKWRKEKEVKQGLLSVKEDSINTLINTTTNDAGD